MIPKKPHSVTYYFIQMNSLLKFFLRCRPHEIFYIDVCDPTSERLYRVSSEMCVTLSDKRETVSGI